MSICTIFCVECLQYCFIYLNHILYQGDSSVESDEDNDNIHDIPEASKSERHIVVEDLEASTDDEEIEEELEIGNVSLDMNDSKVLENIPHLRSSCDVSESLSGRKEKLEHVMSMLDQNKTEDTVVLSFCNSKKIYLKLVGIFF